MSTCCYITKKGTECSRKPVVGETMCKQHIEVDRVEKEKAIQREEQAKQVLAYLNKMKEESDLKKQKQGTEQQRTKFRQDVLQAWNSSKPLLVEESSELGYDSELEVEEDGVGICSTCGQQTYCVKVNHGQVYCVENLDCSHPYQWYYDTPLNYPQEIPEEYRN